MQFQACAYCDHPNPVGTNYCNDCGAALHVKSCRSCGTVAVANASHCPACRAPFPVRPTINVDIPWAVPSRPSTLGGRSARLAAPEDGGASLPLKADAQLAAATEALAETRNLIEKASLRALPRALPDPTPLARRNGSRTQPQRFDPATRQPGAVSPLPPQETRLRPGPAPDSDFEPRALHRARPLVLVTLLGLAASVALLYLVQFAGSETADVTHQVGSPYKLLLRSAGTTPSVPVEPVLSEAPASAAQHLLPPVPATPAPVSAVATVPAPPAPAETAATSPAAPVSAPLSAPQSAPPSVSLPAPATVPGTTAPEALRAPVAAPETPPEHSAGAADKAVAPAPAAAATPAADPAPAAAAAPALDPDPAIPAAVEVTPPAVAAEAVAPAVAAPSVATSTAVAPPSPTAIVPPVRSAAKAMPELIGPPTPAVPSASDIGMTAEPAAVRAAPEPVAPAEVSSSAAPRAQPAPATPPADATAGCRRELQALNLCGKVSQSF
jgi:hypothetical protein